jgi:hypothetical protein
MLSSCCRSPCTRTLQVCGERHTLLELHSIVVWFCSTPKALLPVRLMTAVRLTHSLYTQPAWHCYCCTRFHSYSDFYMSVMRDLTVAEGMWAAYESQAEQRYQEAIQSPGSPQRQVGGADGVTYEICVW